jgi:predicted DNA-binding transcriptional regulator AlpA
MIASKSPSFAITLSRLFHNTESTHMKLIGKAGLMAKGVDLDDTTIWRKEKAGEFPQHVIVGNKRAWVETEIDAYIEGLVAKRDATAEAA